MEDSLWKIHLNVK